MRVVLATHGGQAAAINMRLPPRVLDGDRLPAEEAARLRDLLAAANAETTPEKPGNARDAMSYTITVEDGEESTTITASDTAMSPAFAALLSWLQTQLQAH